MWMEFRKKQNSQQRRFQTTFLPTNAFANLSASEGSFRCFPLNAALAILLRTSKQTNKWINKQTENIPEL